MNAAPFYLFAAIVIIAAAFPLVFRKVKMNPVYGIRIPESFRSEARWYQINRFGGILLVLYSVVLGITGAVGATLDPSQWATFNLVSLAVLLGGMAAVVTAIFIYAARTRQH